MIPIERSQEPESLTKRKYHVYQRAIQQFRDSPAIQVESVKVDKTLLLINYSRTICSPEESRQHEVSRSALKYNESDVKEALISDFFDKCYITEMKLGGANFHIEHFQPKSHVEHCHLEFDYSNLYLSNGTVNMIKGSVEPSGGYLDPCEESHYVDKMFSVRLDTIEESIDLVLSDFARAQPLDMQKKAKNTLELLKKTHCPISKVKTNDAANQFSQHLREQLFKKIRELTKVSMHRFMAQTRKNQVEADHAESLIEQLLMKDQAFTMILRQYAKNQCGYTKTI